MFHTLPMCDVHDYKKRRNLACCEHLPANKKENWEETLEVIANDSLSGGSKNVQEFKGDNVWGLLCSINTRPADTSGEMLWNMLLRNHLLGI